MKITPPIELAHALPKVLDESTQHILQADKPIRGVEEPTVEEHREHVHVQYDEHTHDDDNDIETPELIDDSDDEDESPPHDDLQRRTYLHLRPTNCPREQGEHRIGSTKHV